MKNLFSAVLALILLFALGGCARPGPVAYVTTVPTEETAAPTEAAPPPETAPAEPAFAYGDLKNHLFCFSSGAGGWRTEVRIASDGSFSGIYTDTSAGESGEGYRATVHQCSFTGLFGDPEPVNEYTLRLPILALQTEEAREVIENEMRYICGGSPYGLEQTDSLLLYLPGAPLSQLPEYYLRWVNLFDAEEAALPFYGLYNEPRQNGFSSFDEIQSLLGSIAAAEALDAAPSDAVTQADMNMSAQDRFALWDGLLNQAWELLMARMEGDEKTALIKEERQWIEEKELAVAQAGSEVEGGSLYGAVTAGTAAKMTRERVYMLAEYLEKFA